MVRKIIVSFLAFITLLLAVLPVFAAQKIQVATPQPLSEIPQFVVTAGPGKFPPGSPFHFLDNVVDSIKLMFKFSKEAKLVKRFDIADKKMMQMKIAVHDKNVKNVETAAKEYTSQMTAINNAIKDWVLPDLLRNKVMMRIRADEQSFGFLYALAQDGMVPFLQGASAQLQTVKNSAH